MFIRRADGPHVADLPEGGRMTRADLPPADTERWVASRKAAVVRAVLSGLIAPPEAMARWDLSEEELAGWIAAAAAEGAAGLKATRHPGRTAAP